MRKAGAHAYSLQGSIGCAHAYSLQGSVGARTGVDRCSSVWLHASMGLLQATNDCLLVGIVDQRLSGHLSNRPPSNTLPQCMTMVKL